MGLLRPSAGRVLIDGTPLEGENIHHWRRSVGYVPQEPFLFNETVRANLLWAQPGATEKELRAALRASAAEEFVDHLPSGLDTLVGDRGVRLSGGERQRLTMARALLTQPSILILDEATSSLDTENERLIQEAIHRLHGELTLVVIAHRLSTVRNADSIIELNQGELLSRAPGRHWFLGLTLSSREWCRLLRSKWQGNACTSCGRDTAAAARTIEAIQIWRLCRRNGSK